MALCLQVASGEHWAEQAADRLVEALAAANGARLSVALAGGSTPQSVYRLLAVPPRVARVPWARLDLFVGDERVVAPGDPESNAGQALAALGESVRTAGLRFFRPATEGDLDAAARSYAALLPDPVDLLLLGLGADGHTASLFPGSAVLRETERRVVPVVGPKPPPQRLTITPPVIAAARQILVLARGAGKAAAVAQALVGPWAPERCPAQLARHGVWLIDEAAASELPAEVR